MTIQVYLKNHFLFTPMIPPKIPKAIPIAIIIILCKFNPNLQFRILEIKYIVSMYIPPIKAPLSKPFFLILIFPIELPIKILIAVITIITGFITVSLIPRIC